jgi:hypothetical protein
MPSVPEILQPLALPGTKTDAEIIDGLAEKITNNTLLSNGQILLALEFIKRNPAATGSHDLTLLKALTTKVAPMTEGDMAIRTNNLDNLRHAMLEIDPDLPARLIAGFYPAAAVAAAAVAADPLGESNGKLECPYSCDPIADGELIFLVSKADDKSGKRTICPVSRKSFSEALIHKVNTRDNDDDDDDEEKEEEMKITPTLPTLTPPHNEVDSIITYSTLPEALQKRIKLAATDENAGLLLNTLFDEEFADEKLPSDDSPTLKQSYPEHLATGHKAIKALIEARTNIPNLDLLYYFAKDTDALLPHLQRQQTECVRSEQDIEEQAETSHAFSEDLTRLLEWKPELLKNKKFMDAMSRPIADGPCQNTCLWFFVVSDETRRGEIAEQLTEDKNSTLLIEPFCEAMSRRISDSEGLHDGISGFYYLAQELLFASWVRYHADYLFKQEAFHLAMSKILDNATTESNNMSGWTWIAATNKEQMIPLLDQLLNRPDFISAMSADISEPGENLDCASGFGYLFHASEQGCKKVFGAFQQHLELLSNEAFLAIMEKGGWQALIGEDPYMRRLVTNWAFKGLDNAEFCRLVAQGTFAISPVGRAASEEPEEPEERPAKRERIDGLTVMDWKANPIELPAAAPVSFFSRGRASSEPPPSRLNSPG